MHKCFQDLFVTPKGKCPLRYIGSKKEGCWDQGYLQADAKGTSFPVIDGIPVFVSPSDDSWGNDENVNVLLKKYSINHKTLINDNWQNSIKTWNNRHEYYSWVQRIIKNGGLMLEIACGPGGGFAPLILDINPEATLLMNDMGHWILQEWKKLSDKHLLWSNTSFAQFDAKQCPIRSNSLDSVNSAGGISNIPDNDLVIRETYRILKPGGVLFMVDGELQPESFKKLPEKGQNEINKIMNSQSVEKGYQSCLIGAGFEIVSATEISGRALEPDESDVSKIAGKYGVTIRMQVFKIEAMKPI